MLTCFYVGCIDIYYCNVFPLKSSLNHYVVSFLISCTILYFKIYFVWYKDCYSSFLFLPICMEHNFPPLCFSLEVSLGLKWVSCRQHIYSSCFCIHSASLRFWVGAFNPFIFKVVIDMLVSIPVFLIWGVDFVDLLYCLVFIDYVFPLTFVVNLVWWYWILLTFAVYKAFYFSINFEWDPCQVV